jgi:hypothetical protein
LKKRVEKSLALAGSAGQLRRQQIDLLEGQRIELEGEPGGWRGERWRDAGG